MDKKAKVIELSSYRKLKEVESSRRRISVNFFDVALVAGIVAYVVAILLTFM